MPGRNANAYTDPHAFTYRNSDSDSDGNSYSDRNGDGYGYGYGYGHNHTATPDADCHTHTIGDPASVDAKAAAYALPSADALGDSRLKS